MQQQEPEPCEHCLDILDLDAARLCQQIFDLEPHQLALPLSPPPIVSPRIDPSEIALPLSPPVRFDRLIDLSKASFVSRPQNSTHNVRERSTRNHESISPKPISEPKKVDDRKYISIRELFDDDGMDDAQNQPIPPEALEYVRRNPPNPNSIWYPGWYRYPEVRHLIPDHTWADHLLAPPLQQYYPIENTQRDPPAHQPRVHNQPPSWHYHPLPINRPPYETKPPQPLPSPTPLPNTSSLNPRTTFEILFANPTIGLPPSDIHAIFRYRWRSLPHNIYSIQLSLLDDSLEISSDDDFEWSEHAFEPWVRSEYEMQKLEERILEELEIARIGAIGDGRRRA